MRSPTVGGARPWWRWLVAGALATSCDEPRIDAGPDAPADGPQADIESEPSDGVPSGSHTEPDPDRYHCLAYCRVYADCGEPWHDDEVDDCVIGCLNFVDVHAVPMGAVCVAAVVDVNACVGRLDCVGFEAWLEADPDQSYPCRDEWEHEARVCDDDEESGDDDDGVDDDDDDDGVDDDDDDDDDDDEGEDDGDGMTADDTGAGSAQ